MKKLEYLPLTWAKEMKKTYEEILKPYTVNEMRRILSLDTSPEEFSKLVMKSDKLSFLISKMGKKEMKDFLNDIDAISLIMMWERNKQVFKFDKDFTNELVRTERLKYTKDMYDFLPYECFYIDVSDNKEICNSIIGKGFYVTVDKSLKENNITIHLCKVTERLFFTDTISLKNETVEFSTDELQENAEVKILDDITGTIVERNEKIDSRTYRTLVLQILTYLSSVEPDVKENETTKTTHRAYDPDKPKNKFSEVRMWDVGVRYGNAFRGWQKKIQTHNISAEGNVKSGTPKRPHFRRAHWHTYLYGHGEEKIARAKWVAETFVGKGEAPATIHNVKE